MTDPIPTADLAAIEREIAHLDDAGGKTDPQLLPLRPVPNSSVTSRHFRLKCSK